MNQLSLIRESMMRFLLAWSNNHTVEAYALLEIWSATNASHFALRSAAEECSMMVSFRAKGCAK